MTTIDFQLHRLYIHRLPEIGVPFPLIIITLGRFNSDFNYLTYRRDYLSNIISLLLWSVSFMRSGFGMWTLLAELPDPEMSEGCEVDGEEQ